MFKKISLFVLSALLLVGLTGCGEEKNLDMSLEDIMTSLYADIPEDERPMLGNINVLQDVPDNIEYYIGTTDIEYEEILASEPMMGSIAHSVVLVKMKDGADIETAKEKILDTVNPRKWVCVGVEKEEVIIKSKGDLIILIIMEDENIRTKIEEGFDKL